MNGVILAIHRPCARKDHAHGLGQHTVRDKEMKTTCLFVALSSDFSKNVGMGLLCRNFGVWNPEVEIISLILNNCNSLTKPLNLRLPPPRDLCGCVYATGTPHFMVIGHVQWKHCGDVVISWIPHIECDLHRCIFKTYFH